MKIKFKLENGNYACNDVGVADFYVVPTKENLLSQVPKGVNPRDCDTALKKIKDIYAAYSASDNRFIINNGGMQIIIDDSSRRVWKENGVWWLEFTCNADLAGHYDGQHTQYAVDKAIKDAEENISNSVKLTLIDKSCFADVETVRKAAENWNSRTRQTATSEHDVLGAFKELKSHIPEEYLTNVGFRQHQCDPSGQKIKPENEVQQLLRLLAGFLPLTYEDKMAVDDIAKLAKGAENKALQLITSCPYRLFMSSTYKYVSWCLELSDYIQETLKDVLGEELHKEFDLLKQTSKSQLGLPTTQRKFYKQSLWKATQVEGALDKDYVPMFVYAMINKCFEYDFVKGEFTQLYDITEAKAIWRECGKELLQLLNGQFRGKFTSEYKSRKSDFINQPAKWTQATGVVAKTIRNGDWRARVKTSLKEV